MAGPKPQDAYDSVNSVAPETASPNDYQQVNASPNAFGEQIGEATQRLGSAGLEATDRAFEVADQQRKMAIEAKANDTIVNQWAPTVAKISSAYQQTQGMNAVNGFDGFVSNLQSQREQVLNQAASPYEKQILGNYMTRHVAQEVDTARRHQDQQITEFQDKSALGFQKTISDNVISNYNNPDVVTQGKAQLDAQIQKHGMDRGMSDEMIAEQQRTAWGNTIKDAVGRSIANGDVSTASGLYKDNIQSIAGPEQLEIEKLLHSENMRQTGVNNAKALLAGQPLPPSPAGTPAQVKSVVADTAQKSGVDPNQALTVASLESDFGQNTGKRGDIGQTGKGGDIPEQAQNMVGALKQSKALADTATGRDAQPWETYVVYQQGAGGGPALLKAVVQNPTAKAVDVLQPLYGTPKEALSAVVNNGGNATMTAGQFLDFIKTKYDAHADRAQMSLPPQTTAPEQNPLPGDQTAIVQQPPASVGDAITAPHETGGIAVQPGASPVQDLIQMDKVYPDALMRANQIPNNDQREATINALEQQHRVYQSAAAAYTTTIINQAQQLAVNPKFTSMDQVPPEMTAALLSDHPQTLAYLQARAEYNVNHESGAVTKDQKEYGGGVDKVLNGIWDGSISSVTQLHTAVQNHDLTISGFDKMSAQLEKVTTPQGKAELAMQKAAFDAAQLQITHGMKDNPAMATAWASALPALFGAIADRQKRDIPPGQYYDPSNKEFIGNDVKALQANKAKAVASQIQANQAKTQPRTLADIVGEAQATNDPATQAKLRQEAIDRGFYDPKAPAVPLAGQE